MPVSAEVRSSSLDPFLGPQIHIPNHLGSGFSTYWPHGHLRLNDVPSCPATKVSSCQFLVIPKIHLLRPEILESTLTFLSFIPHTPFSPLIPHRPVSKFSFKISPASDHFSPPPSLSLATTIACLGTPSPAQSYFSALNGPAPRTAKMQTFGQT